MKNHNLFFSRLSKILLAGMFIFAASVPPSAYAAVDDFIDKFSANDIMFYDPDECEGGSSGGTVTGGEAVVSGSTAEEKVWSGLKSMGLTDEVTAGIMGNMAHEGNFFNPAQHEGSFQSQWGHFALDSNSTTSYGIGLIQWSFGRRVNVYNYIKGKSSGLIKYLDNPYDYSYANGSAYGMNGDGFIKKANNETEVNALYSLELSFLINEEFKNNTTYAGVLKQTTVNGAADYFLEKVEIPANIEGTRPLRRQTANEIFSKYSGKTSFGSGSTSSGSSSSTAVSGNNITVIGDSITNSEVTRNAYNSKLSGVDIHAQDSKQFDGTSSDNPTGIQILTDLVNAKELRDVLIFALGTNNTGLQKASVDKVLELAKDAKKIVFVTNFTTSGNYDSNNKLMNDAASANPGKVIIADWAKVVKDDPSKYLGDGTHPKDSAAGEKYVDTIVSALSSGTPASTNSTGTCSCDTKTQDMSSFSGQKYDLTDGQLKGIIAVAKAENGGTLHGLQLELSIMPNLYEHNSPNGERTGTALVKYVLEGGWFSKNSTKEYSEDYSGYSSDEWDAAVSILREGNRTIPAQILEHDSINDIGSIELDGTKYTDAANIKKFENYKTGKTKINNNMGSSYIFYTWANPDGTQISDSSGGNLTGDPFGYFEDNAPSQSSNGSNGDRTTSSVSWTDGWISGGMDGYTKEDANDASDVLHEASKTSFTTDSPKGGKGANKILLHDTEGTNGDGNSGLALYSTVSRPNTSGKTPAHFTIDIKNKKVYQHFSINQPAEAIKGSGDDNIVNDAMAGIQIEIIGFGKSSQSEIVGSQWYLPNDSNFKDEDWDYLAKLLVAISNETGIKLTSTVDWLSPTRLSADDFKNYQGILGHMHAPADNDHTDPAGIWDKVKSAIERAQGLSDGECSWTATGDVASLQKKVLEFAWPEYHHAPYDAQMPKYTDVVNSTSYYHGGCAGNDCGGFVTTLMHESGWDTNYNSNNGDVDAQYAYVKDETNGWKDVTDTIKSNDDAKPGDVLIKNRYGIDHGHTLVFVGSIPGFSSEMASAAYDGDSCSSGSYARSPMADGAKDISYYINSGYGVFRKAK